MPVRDQIKSNPVQQSSRYYHNRNQSQNHIKIWNRKYYHVQLTFNLATINPQ